MRVEHGGVRCDLATAATCRVWFDWTPPIETSVSQPLASASATRYSSLRVLFPPNAMPELQSSRLAHSCAPPSCRLSRSSRCTGDGPNSNGSRANDSIVIGVLLFLVALPQHAQIHRLDGVSGTGAGQSGWVYRVIQRPGITSSSSAQLKPNRS